MKQLTSIMMEIVLVAGATVFWAVTLLATFILFPVVALGTEAAALLRQRTIKAAPWRGAPVTG